MRNGGAERERERGAELVKRICIKMRAIVSDYSFGLIYIFPEWQNGAQYFYFYFFFQTLLPPHSKLCLGLVYYIKKEKRWGGGAFISDNEMHKERD